MSTNPETPAETEDQNLDDFAADFFGQKEAAPEPTNSEVEEKTEDSSDAQTNEDQDTQTDDDTEEGDVDETTEDGDTEEEVEQPKPKKNRFQERIDELTAKAREEERKAEALATRLAELESKLAKPDENAAPKPQNTEAKEGPTPPKPDDLNEDGTERFPLGEFDPAYQDALIEFKLEQRLAQAEQQREQREREQQIQQARSQVEEQWNGQLNDARQRYDDFEDKLTTLTEMTVQVPEDYGNYLADTIMSMDHGADVLYYLSQNPDEVTAIINSGARKATIALGRIEAQFSGGSEKPTKSVKPSKAPPPPPANKGAAIARGTVAPDTDNLDDFASLFFKK